MSTNNNSQRSANQSSQPKFKGLSSQANTLSFVDFFTDSAALILDNTDQSKGITRSYL